MPHHSARDGTDQPRQQEQDPQRRAPVERAAQQIGDAEPDHELERHRHKREDGDVAGRGAEQGVADDRRVVGEPRKMHADRERRVRGEGREQTEERGKDEPAREEKGKRREQEQPVATSQAHFFTRVTIRCWGGNLPAFPWRPGSSRPQLCTASARTISLVYFYVCQTSSRANYFDSPNRIPEGEQARREATGR